MLPFFILSNFYIFYIIYIKLLTYRHIYLFLFGVYIFILNTVWRNVN